MCPKRLTTFGTKGLLFKLKTCGIDRDLVKLLENYISGRKERVVLNGKTTLWGDIDAGVLQGSVLGPLLFLIYTNDLPDNLKSNPKLFADDTSIFSVITDPNTSFATQKDLDELFNWSVQWRMLFNPDS